MKNSLPVGLNNLKNIMGEVRTMSFCNLFDLIDDSSLINVYIIKKSADDGDFISENEYSGTKFDFPYRLSYLMTREIIKVYCSSYSGICVDVSE